MEFACAWNWAITARVSSSTTTSQDEEKHIDWLEAQLDQIGQMGLRNYLLAQTDK